MSESCIDFDLAYEYINDADQKLAMECDRRWREKVKQRNERQLVKILTKFLVFVDFRRLL